MNQKIQQFNEVNKYNKMISYLNTLDTTKRIITYRAGWRNIFLKLNKTAGDRRPDVRSIRNSYRNVLFLSICPF